jgi:DNA-binding IscR family transcriptional regulator
MKSGIERKVEEQIESQYLANDVSLKEVVKIDKLSEFKLVNPDYIKEVLTKLKEDNRLEANNYLQELTLTYDKEGNIVEA